MQASKTKEEGMIKFKFNRRIIMQALLMLGSFAAARALVFDVASPFAIAYIAPFLLKGNKFYFVALLSAAGVLTAFRQDFSVKYLLAILILCAVNLLVSFNPKAKRGEIGFLQAILAGAAVTIAGFVLIFVRGQGVFYMVINVLEGSLIFAMAIVLAKAMTVMTPSVKRGVLGNEELLAVLVLAAVITVGISDVHIWLFGMRHVAAAIIVLLAAASGGAAVGTVCGMMLGIMLNLTGYEYIFFAILLGIGGFAAGAVRFGGRAIAFGAFVAATFFAALYFDFSLISWAGLASLGFAGLVFFVLPNEFLLNINSKINPASNSQEEHLEKMREQVLERVYNIAGGYGKLAKIFEGRIAGKTQESSCSKNLTKTAKDGTCRHCKSFAECWVNNESETQAQVSEIIKKGEKRGKLYIEDAPLDFQKKCVRFTDFMGQLAASLEMERQAAFWQRKVIETKSTIHQQFSGLSSVMYEFALELSAVLNSQKELENKILREFIKEKIEVESLIVIENTVGKYEISLTRKGGRGDSKIAKHIANIISTAIGRKMQLGSEHYRGRTVHLNYQEKQKYYVHSGIAKANKELAPESGDSFSVIQLRDGRLVAALSDGMGSGTKAKDGSSATIELLEELMEKGFKKDIAIKLINSALLLKSHDEFFSTLDICLIDMNQAVAEFIKIGAHSSYLMRHGEVESIGSWTLPVGILESIEIDTCQRQLSHGDIIVMLTDGVADSVKNSEGDWIKELLEKTNMRSPQDLADYILEEAKRNYGRRIGDDMTVMVLRIMDKN